VDNTWHKKNFFFKFLPVSDVGYQQLILILTMYSLSSDVWNKSIDVLLYQSRKNICLLPTLLFPSISPCNISWSILYHWLFLIICPMYSIRSIQYLIVVKNSFSFLILFNTPIQSFRAIYSINLYSHIKKVSIFFSF